MTDTEIQQKNSFADMNNLGSPSAVPTTLPFSSIQGGNPIVTPPPTNPAATLNSLVASTAQAVTDATTQDTSAQSNVDTTTNDLSSLIASLGGQTADQNAAEGAAGLPTLNKDLLDLQNTARQQNIEYQTTPYSLAGQGRGITTGILRGQEAVKQRQVGIDLLVTNSNIAAKQGNILLAQNLADKAVAAKYDPIKQAIQAKQFILTQQTASLSRADSKLAAAKSAELSLQLKKIEQQETEAKQLQDFTIKIAPFAPPSVLKSLNDLSTSGDPQALYKAVQLGGKYLTDPIDRSYKIAQTQKLLADAKATNIGDPIETLAFAQQYHDTGKIPVGVPKGTFGSVAQLAKDLPMQNGQLLSRSTGINPSNIGAEAQQGLIGIYNAIEKGKEIKELDKNRWGGLLAGTIGWAAGSTAQNSYVSARNLALKELQYALSGKAITQQEFDYFDGLLPTRFSNQLGLGVDSQDAIDTFNKNLSETLNNKLNGYGASISGFSTVKIGDQEYKVGDVISNGNGQFGRLNADGSVTLVQ